MGNKKFELTENTKEWNGIILYQLRALIPFGNVKSGELGGWVEKEENLSQDGDAWVGGNAWVYGNAHVSGNAQVSENAFVGGTAFVHGNACVYGDARVCGYARLGGDAQASGNARVRGDARMYKEDDYIAIDKIGSRIATTTIYKDEKLGIAVSCGCFLGSLKQFEEAVEKTHRDSKYGREYKAVIALAKAHFELDDEHKE